MPGWLPWRRPAVGAKRQLVELKPVVARPAAASHFACEREWTTKLSRNHDLEAPSHSRSKTSRAWTSRTPTAAATAPARRSDRLGGRPECGGLGSRPANLPLHLREPFS